MGKPWSSVKTSDSLEALKALRERRTGNVVSDESAGSQLEQEEVVYHDVVRSLKLRLTPGLTLPKKATSAASSTHVPGKCVIELWAYGRKEDAEVAYCHCILYLKDGRLRIEWLGRS